MIRILLISMFSCSLGFSNILEVSSISSMNKYQEDGVLFLYDIDNTLIKTAQMLGSDEWFFHRYADLKKEETNNSKALDKALCEWISVQYATNVEEVEEGSTEIVKSQQAKKIMLMGFTTRDHCLAKITRRQLSSLGFDLSKTAPKDKIAFIKEDRCIVYQDGVLYTAGSHKGETLFTFLKKQKIHPTGIVFINDRISNLEEVEEKCEKRGIPFVGLRYNYLEEKVKAFNPKITKIQRDDFFTILTDKEASLIL